MGYQDDTQQLGRIEGKLDILLSTLQRHIEEDARAFHGEDGQPGLIVKVDRLEQSAASQRRGFWMGLTALSGVALDLLAHTFHLR